MRGLRLIGMMVMSLGILLIATWWLHGRGVAAMTCEYQAAVYERLDPEMLAQELETTGLIGDIHGSASPLNLAVLSIAEPGNFFNRRQFSLIAANRTVKETLNQLHRHDRVCLHGRALANPSPQPHLLIDAIEVLETWSGLADYPEYEYTVEFPADLRNPSRLVAKVHAVAADGQVLVVEYQDGVLPIFVESPTPTIANLYRGDIVELRYRIQRRPGQPTHLQLDRNVAEPVRVLDAIAAAHETPRTLSGYLVKFPQSPQLNFDVYAIAVATQGIERTYTLVNFSDPDVFTAIRDQLAQLWEAHIATIEPGRNQLVNRAIALEVTGTVNVVSPEQANPQLLLNRVEDIVVQP